MIVWLASYPRSGNTLTRIIINKRFSEETFSLHGDNHDIGVNAEMTRLTGHANTGLLSRSRIELMRQSSRRYYIKTHRLPDWYASIDDLVVYIIRDCRDVISSYYNYLKKFSKAFVSLEDVIVGQVPFGAWADHIVYWSELPSDRVLTMRYEDYLLAPDQFIQNLGDFLDLEDTGVALPDFESLNAINKHFFRSGGARSWEHDIDNNNLDLFWAIHGDVMDAHGYPNTDSEKKSDCSVRPEWVVRTRMRASRERLEIQRKENDDLIKQLAGIKQNLDDLIKQLAGIKQNLDDLIKQLAGIKQNLRESGIKLDAANVTLRQMVNSTSWRITGGLRWLATQYNLVRSSRPSADESAP